MGGNATFPIYRLMMPVISKAGIRFATTPGITPISAPPLVVGSLAAASFIFDDDAFPPRLHAAMQAAGWQRGRDYRLVVRSGDGTNEAYPALVRELIALQPSVIVPFGDGAIRAVQAATTTIPVSAIADD